ncbi:unnamed protein product [Cercopithifilaria johnstoni]|uniref:Uncharacterized protein n=1 Tax=Cercopithifilaria johnstoni TaxID=2874296 RepID=A0A8J2LMK9_9BILA|nr:unnamed protein product [Cercopithifilaria johnstoni]
MPRWVNWFTEWLTHVPRWLLGMPRWLTRVPRCLNGMQANGMLDNHLQFFIAIHIPSWFNGADIMEIIVIN